MRNTLFTILSHRFSSTRLTDMCSHCATLDQKIVPAFRKAWLEIQSKLEIVMPGYLSAFRSDQESACAIADKDALLEARLALRYIQKHAARFKNERSRLSLRDQLTLWSFTEAPAEACLKSHFRLAESYSWHRLSARRQPPVFRSMMEPAGLPMSDSFCIFDWREKIVCRWGLWRLGKCGMPSRKWPSHVGGATHAPNPRKPRQCCAGELRFL